MDFPDANRNIMQTSSGNKGEIPLTNRSNLPGNLKTLHLIFIDTSLKFDEFSKPDTTLKGIFISNKHSSMWLFLKQEF